MDMSAFIANDIIKTCNLDGLEAAKARYRGWFITTTLYAAYKANTDTILTTDGFGACIVTV